MRFVQGLAVVGAASVADLVVFVTEALVTGAFRAGGFMSELNLVSVIGTVVVSVTPAVLVVLPVLSLLAWGRRLSWLTAAVSGVAAGGGLTVLVVVALNRLAQGAPSDMVMALTRVTPIVTGGMVAGWGAWRAMQRRVKPEDTAEMF